MNHLIGQKLKTLRIQHGLSQEVLADMLYVSQSTYARMERGKSNSWVNHIEAFCKIFHIVPEDLVRFQEETPLERYCQLPIQQMLQIMMLKLEKQLREKDALITHLRAELQKAASS
ncbi:helix-turn-helix domain-containing protein [Flavobacterium sp. JP2137]|uniref:helix-turn-helix transcriptional regulator n=1 Tax=Flavobacterium sp. JP2137 TaxID=3414510 RepID=UPI003D301448